MSQLNPLRNSEYVSYLSHFERQFYAKRAQVLVMQSLCKMFYRLVILFKSITAAEQNSYGLDLLTK